MNSEEYEISKSFKSDNSTWGLELPELKYDFGEFLLKGGFDYSYCKSVSHGKLDFIDFKTCHRMTSDGYIRYYSNGKYEEVDYEIMKEGGFDKIPIEDIAALTRVKNIEFGFEFNKIRDKEFEYQEFEFFWSNESPFSQWHKTSFQLNGVEYTSAEQFMMAKKAELFNDHEIKNMILATSNVRKQKELGRIVKNYSDEIWDQQKIKIVYIANNLKFSQNPELKTSLMNTDNRLLVEASPYDKIWGIGISEDDDLRFNKENWVGENLLGKILTQLREDYKQTEKYTTHNVHDGNVG